MRSRFAGILIVMCIFILGAAAAAENKLAIPDTYQVKFSENVRVADTLLPKGNYEIRHVMEGANHIMVFRQLGTKKPAEVRAKCTLVPLSAKATESQTIYVLNAANQRVLQELVFKGEDAKHVF
jgi:hypothetical protein